MRFLLFALLLAGFTSPLAAQPELGKNMVYGRLIQSPGDTLEGVILLNDKPEYAYLLQNRVGFISAEEWQGLDKAKKSSFEMYKPKDVEGYAFDDKVFVSRRYANPSQESPNLGYKKNNYFYEHAMNLGDTEFLVIRSVANKAIAASELYQDWAIYRPATMDGPQNAVDFDYQGYVADCDDLTQRLKDGVFPSLKYDENHGKKKKKKGLGKFIQNQIDAVLVAPAEMDDVINLLSEYAIHCEGK